YAPPSKLNPKVPPEIDAVVVKALASKQKDRWQTAGHFARAMERAGAPVAMSGEQLGELVRRDFGERLLQVRWLLDARPGAGEVQQRFDQLTSVRPAPAFDDEDETEAPTKSLGPILKITAKPAEHLYSPPQGARLMNRPG